MGMVAAVVFALMADDEPPHPEPHQARGGSLFPSGVLWAFFILSSIAFSCRDFAGSSLGSLGSLFLQKAHGLDTEATGKILSSIFLASAISNPLFGGLGDRNRGFWLGFVLVMAALMLGLFPHVPVSLAAPVLAIYGFFVMASYPMVEAALMNAVPHKIRGKVFGFFITITGLIGNLAHWAAGLWVHRLGNRAAAPANYYGTFLALALLMGLSLFGIGCLKALRKRESVAEVTG